MRSVERYTIEHRTMYVYEDPINSCVMLLCAQPRDYENQKVLSFSVNTLPQTQFSVEFDAFGNRHHFFDIQHPHDQLTIEVNAVVEREVDSQANRWWEPPTDSWQQLSKLKNDWAMWDFLSSTKLTEMTDQLKSWAETIQFDEAESPLSRVERLCQHIHDSFDYVPGSTDVDSTINELLSQKKGVCQDYAHLMLSVLRSWGIPARYVSGYFYQSPEPQDQKAESAMHAWIECWIPGLEWVPFDPTNANQDESRLITVAFGRDYGDVAPTRGITLGGGKTELSVGVLVKRLETDETVALRQTQSMQQ